MKPSFITGVVIGYVLGARAGRERYEDIVAIARRIVGSQTIQATAGVVQAQAAELAARTKDRIAAHVPVLKTVATSSHRMSAGLEPGIGTTDPGTNGHPHTR
jgi:hypothetical protein